MPVEKTVEELFERRKKELKDWQYGTVYKLYDREEECEVLADDVDRYFDNKFIQEVKQQVRREVEEELKGLKVYIVNINENYATTFEAKAVYMVDDVAEVLKGITLKN